MSNLDSSQASKTPPARSVRCLTEQEEVFDYVNEFRPKNRVEPVPQFGRNRIAEIATSVHALLYAEMIKLAEELWGAADAHITRENLPDVLNRWAKNRK